MFICDKCNSEYEELPKDVDICPFCGGLLEEAEKCDKCGEYFAPAINEHICRSCMSKLVTFENTYKYISELGDTSDIYVNAFLKCACKVFKVDVDKLIYEHLKKTYTDRELDDGMRKTSLFMMRLEGSDAEEFLLKEDE